MERGYIDNDHRPFCTPEQLLVRVEGRRQVALEQRRSLSEVPLYRAPGYEPELTDEELRTAGFARLDAIIAVDEEVLAEIRAELARG